MKNDLTTHRTSLSHTNDIIGTLEWKIKVLTDSELPVQEGLADYIGLSIEEIEMQERQLKELKAQLSAREKELKEQKQNILQDGAKFFEQYGIDRMDGNMVSSVTITKGKDATTKQKFVTNLTSKEKEALIYDAGFGHYEDVEVEALKPRLKINKRKIIVPEVEE